MVMVFLLVISGNYICMFLGKIYILNKCNLGNTVVVLSSIITILKFLREYLEFRGKLAMLGIMKVH